MPETSSRLSDLTRQFAIIAAMVGVGAFGGTPVQDLQDGALGADGSYLAPASPAFRIWSVIYLGLVAYAAWHALPSQRGNQRQRALGWWVALSMVLVANTAGWLTELAAASWESFADAAGTLVLAAVVAIGIAIGWSSRGRVAPALAIAWGLAWLAVGRFTGEPRSSVIAGAAVVAAIVVLVPPAVAFAKRRSAI